MSIFDGMPREQLEAALASARDALIALQTGNAIASVSYTQGDGGKSVTRRVTSVGEVTALIVQLQIALGLRGPRRARPVRYL